MTHEELEAFLTQREIQFTSKDVQHAVQIRCAGGEIFVCYHTGKVVFQGKQATELAQAVKAWYETGFTPAPSGATAPPSGAPLSTTIFVVYGHDIQARDNLELMLRRMGLKPIILGNLPAAGDTIIEKLMHHLGDHANVGYACVILTPDDEGHPADQPERSQYRARQNVILELGMVLARLGRRRVAILYKETVEQPSDIAGLIYLPFKERIAEVAPRLFQELKGAGYDPDPDALS
jgi:predicted nucleotide-binding protein